MSISHNPPVSGLRWTVFSGDRETVFLELGAHFSAAILDIRSRAGQQWQSLLAKTASGLFRERLHAIIESTRRLCPVESFEMDTMARGAGISELDLWTYNLRGDLGRDGTGCSDIGLATGSSLVIGHNEDGSGQLAPDICLITLRIEGDPDCTVIWYPGFLPANSFVSTGAGLVWGLDHVPVAVPELKGAGRHFVARHGQRQHTGSAARKVVSSIPCAGGFSFNIGDRDDASVTMIENAAGSIDDSVIGKTGHSQWHTNHLRFLDATGVGLAIDPDDQWLSESRTRGAVLGSRVGTELDAATAFEVLRSEGVLNTEPELYTLATTVANLANDRIRVQGRTGPWHGVLSAFTRGEFVEAEA